MKRKSKSRGFIAFAVFVVIIISSGFALQAADTIDSPFDDIAFTSQWLNGGEQQFAKTFGQPDETLTLAVPDSASSTGSQVDLTSLSGTNTQFELPPLGADTEGSASTDMDFGGGRDGQNGIVWSDIGGILYNVWFICMTTAVFIVVQYVFKFSMKQIKKINLPRIVAA